ncbi:NAD(P)/FAD-dependent oxidoreductase [Alkalicoccobacillus murimartini]|uniref:Thioredoxin reductase (NADPH) n=1 Tax=Alkalicoccobacillus murimartini TaxID=171685 RepID=A0ABT9YLV2_9BACI|nr:NAD(P)/FAD-dependent oxidoreductase [Alkalicoccobacillus murimartini]MDQ0208835.1 thioredoxin reductase (NADPH) [Alkalicoccobacillus murimartini]
MSADRIRTNSIFDCAIIGGGPAGLSAALVLGRARRNILLFDDNSNRNQVTHESHGFITRDGTSPSEFRKIGRQELATYPSITSIAHTVTSITFIEDGSYFNVVTKDEQTFHAKKILLAVGFKESLPSIEGISTLYGKSLFNCPYCDGWELRDQPLIIINDSEHAAHLAKIVFNWSKDLVLATNGTEISSENRALLENKGITITTEKIRRLHGEYGQLSEVEFESGVIIKRSGGFVNPTFLFNPLRDELGCDFTESGALVVDEFGRTSKEHIYAAGDAISPAYSQLIVSAASGNKAAVALNADLTNEEFQ